MGKNHGLLTYVFIALVFIVAIWVLLSSMSGNQHMTKYSDILAYFDEYKVTDYTLDLGTGELKYTLEGEEKQHTY